MSEELTPESLRKQRLQQIHHRIESRTKTLLRTPGALWSS
jgi:hypothetical protein